MLRLAESFVGRDPDRPLIGGVCLDPVPGGTPRIVATDGHRLLLAAAPGLAGLDAPIVLGPWAGLGIPEAEAATLEIGDREAVLRVEGVAGRNVGILDGPFVPYETLTRTSWPIVARLPASALLRLLELFARLDESAEGLVRLIELRLVRDGSGSRLVASTTRNQGGSPGAAAPPPPDVPDWTFHAEVAVVIEAPGPADGDGLRLAVNLAYLREAVLAVDPTSDAQIELCFTDAVAPFLCRSPSRPGREMMTMPMRVPEAPPA